MRSLLVRQASIGQVPVRHAFRTQAFRAQTLRILLLINFLCLAVNAPADTAVLAGGCFWCMESDFEKLEGVTDVVSGSTLIHLMGEGSFVIRVQVT